MDLDHLTPEELDFELAIRSAKGLKGQDRNWKTLRLLQLISKENGGGAAAPTASSHVLSDVDSIYQCQAKLPPISQALESALRQNDEDQVRVCRSRLLHYRFRLSVISDPTITVNAKNTLAKIDKTLERIEEFLVNLACANPDNEEDNPDPEELPGDPDTQQRLKIAQLQSSIKEASQQQQLLEQELQQQLHQQQQQLQQQEYQPTPENQHELYEQQQQHRQLQQQQDIIRQHQRQLQEQQQLRLQQQKQEQQLQQLVNQMQQQQQQLEQQLHQEQIPVIASLGTQRITQPCLTHTETGTGTKFKYIAPSEQEPPNQPERKTIEHGSQQCESR
ncbi:bromodomain-containing protein DDB_G0280777-like [Ochlerotatus camptorhynchus]|uniref:bromodomain-containing protein DDB_G0280777-like n=1 Tax=Ochlerotatus camptorhynchus TaxID=644619 RepID=UPI0031D50329